MSVVMHWVNMGKGPIWQAYEDAQAIVDPWAHDVVALPWYTAVTLSERFARRLLHERGYDAELLDRILDCDVYNDRSEIADLLAELERTRRVGPGGEGPLGGPLRVQGVTR